MNEKIQAITLKLVVALQKEKWNVDKDWQITLKSEGHVPLRKYVSVRGNLGDEDWSDDVDTTIDLRLASDDEITFFPEFTMYATLYISGGGGKDVAHKTDADVAFVADDFNDDKKIQLAAKKISNGVSEYIENEYSNYVDQNASDIQSYKMGGYKGDEM